MKLRAVIHLGLISWSWGWPHRERNVQNHSCMNTITIGNSWHYQGSTPVDSSVRLSSKNGVMTQNWRQVWPAESIIKSLHRPRRWEEPSSSCNPQPDITSQKHLKILLRTKSTYSKCRPYFTYVNMPHIRSWRPTHSQYSHQRVVETFGALISYYNKQCSTCLSRVL